MSVQIGLPGVGQGFGIADQLGRCYTPDSLALSLVSALRVRQMGVWIPISELGTVAVAEPSIGGGAFARALRAVNPFLQIVGVDLDEACDGAKYADAFFHGAWEDQRRIVNAKHNVRLIIGNPPFDDPMGGDPDRAQRFVRSVFEHFEELYTLDRSSSGEEDRYLPAPQASFILPLAYLGTKAWAPLLEHASMTPIVGRPWPKQAREVAMFHFYSFAVREHSQRTIFPPISF